MNFELGTYNVRLTFNPADVTIRMEHRENRRLYESVFMTEDFDGLAAIGGLTTIEKILKAAFGPDSSAKISIVEEKIDTLTLKVEVSGLISKCWTLGLAARRRESGDTAVEVEELRTKIKELQAHVNELEEENKGYILIPNCPVIPFDITKINFVESMTPEFLPIKCTSHGCINQNIPFIRLSTYNTNTSYPNYISCLSGHWISFPFKDYHKLISMQQYDLETNTYTVKDPFHIQEAYYSSPAQDSLEELSITHTKKIYIQFIQRYHLKKLTLHCPNLEDIEGIENCKTLEEIDLEGCAKITNINMLAKLPALTKLNIKGTGVKNTVALTNSRLMIEK